MQSTTKLEKQFYKQRDQLVRDLNKDERLLKNELDKLLKQLTILKTKKKNTEDKARKTKKQLQLTQWKVIRNKKQVKDDASKIRFMTARIKQLKKEIPTLEANIKKLSPEKYKLEITNRKFDRTLIPLNKKIKVKKDAINKIKFDMRKLQKKENFLKQGRISWGEFKRRIRKKQQQQMIQKPQKKSFFGRLFKK